MTLAHEFVGVGKNATFVHGFTQTSQSWKPLLAHLRTSLHSQLIDAPGHGLSPDGARTLWESGRDIVETMHTGILVGYSMGARMCLHAALLNSAKITSLILISGTAGIRNHQERTQRIQNDNELADRICEIGVNAFIPEWMQQPLFTSLPKTEEDVSDRKRNSSQGLADSLRYAGTGTQQPLWDELHKITVPVLLIAGERDTKFVQIAQEMHIYLPHSTLCVIPDSGHSVHLERTSIVAAEIDRWLLQTDENSH
jgi:2-succinyl-6-hydroxy-2,4-cyclohexadiene-1-carboxylate synthase